MLGRESSARLSGVLQRRWQTCFTVPSKPLSAQNVAARIRGVRQLWPHVVIEDKRENRCAQAITGSRSVSLCRSASLDIGFRM